LSRSASRTSTAKRKKRRGARLNHTIVWCRDQEKSAGFVYFECPDGHLLELITRPYGDPKDL
jgi:hypothetical protein